MENLRLILDVFSVFPYPRAHAQETGDLVSTYLTRVPRGTSLFFILGSNLHPHHA